MKNSTKKVILGCRNKGRAEAAVAKLIEETGKQDVFEILIMDVMDLESIKSAVSTLSEPVDAVILNAGGPGKEQNAKTNHGSTQIMALNVTGHAFLVDELIRNRKLAKGSTVIYASSEAARGVKSFGFPAPIYDSGSVEEFKDAINGNKFVELKDQSYETVYGYAKSIGVLWSGGMSRKFPDFRFISVTPGMTFGTNLLNDLNGFTKYLFIALGPILKFFGVGHDTDFGAKRYLDAMYDFETEQKYSSGHFYGSVNGLTGPMGDQYQFHEILGEESFQDNALEAIQTFF